MSVGEISQTFFHDIISLEITGEITSELTETSREVLRIKAMRADGGFHQFTLFSTSNPDSRITKTVNGEGIECQS